MTTPTTLSAYLGTGAKGAARKAALVELAREAGHMYDGKPSIGRFLCDMADKAHTKPVPCRLESDLLPSIMELTGSDLDWLTDALTIRRLQIMSGRLKVAGFETVTGDSHGWAWQSYIIVRGPVSSSAYADLAECQVLLDTAREMKDAAAAFERWLPKVKEVRRD